MFGCNSGNSATETKLSGAYDNQSKIEKSSHEFSKLPNPIQKLALATVGLEIAGTNNSVYSCTGVALSPSTVLTSGHCVNYPIKEITLVTDVNAKSYYTRATVPVKNIKITLSYNGDVVESDWAVITFQNLPEYTIPNYVENNDIITMDEMKNKYMTNSQHKGVFSLKDPSFKIYSVGYSIHAYNKFGYKEATQFNQYLGLYTSELLLI
ncbi:MAG: trypsin-like serine protease [Burkholderiales bacterium]|nr:trypsin-like serine protease [Burkholderiales bacterium]